jgi:hypothetical protein
MGKKARLGLYLQDEEFKRQVKVAAAKRDMTVTEYCTEAIEERLVRNGERSAAASKSANVDREKQALLERMDELRREIGPVGAPASELVEEGRRS